MNFARFTPSLAASTTIALAATLSACSGSSTDPVVVGSGGVGGLPGLGGQASGGTSVGQGGTNSGNGGTTSAQQGGNGNGGAQQGGNASGGAQQGGSLSGGATGIGGAATGGATNRGGNANVGGASVGGSATGGKATTGGSVNAGGAATGGKATSGGAANVGGATTGGKAATGGVSAGGAATGGAPATGGAATGGKAATGGAPATGGAASTGSVFNQCRFHFGTIDSIAKNNGTSMISQLDYFTPGWMLGSAFDQSYVCTEANSGGALAGLVPVVVAYVAAGNVKRDHSLCDCNVSGCSGGDLCKTGAQYIVQDWTKIINAYKSYSSGYAACYGTTKPIIFEMEPDWYQYTYTSQSAPWTAAQAASRMAELVAALKTNLPNARFSIDASPWVGSNGTDNGAAWYANFNMSLFTFVNTSGGGTNADTAKIRSSNNMTWAGLNSVTGKPILADTGYGANGMSAGHDPKWDVVANINARIADGVISIAQYNPSSNWGSTISSIRSQLSTPKYCP